MKKQTEILIKTGKGKFIPIGTAELDLEIDYKNSFVLEMEVKKVTLNRLNINVKKGDIIYEK